MKSPIRPLLISAMCLMILAACAKNKPAAPEAFYGDAATYQFGQTRKDLASIEEQIRKAPKSDYRAIEAKLLVLLNSPQTETDAKRYVCRYLGIVGSSRSVPALATLLGDERLSHPARMALEVMPNSDAGKALREAMPKLQGKLLAGVIGSVGARRDEKAVAALVKLSGDADAAVSSAAIAALGNIGTETAVRSLNDHLAGLWMMSVPIQSRQRAIAKALTMAADRLAKDDEVSRAAAIYRGLMDKRHSAADRIAGAKGLVGVSKRTDAISMIIDMLEGEDVTLRSAAIAAFNESSDRSLKSAVVEKLPSMKPAGQIALLAVLNDHRDVPARKVILAIVEKGTADAHVAAIECLAVHGEPADVAVLAKFASAEGTSGEKDAAKRALGVLGKPGTNDAVVKLLESPDAATRTLAIWAVGARRISTAMPSLTKIASGSDLPAATAAFGAIGELGGAEELAFVVDLIVRGSDDGLRSSAEKAAASICTRLGDSAMTAPPVLAAWRQSTTTVARVAVVRLLPRVRGNEALAALVEATKDADPAVREAAVRALADWPDLGAVPRLVELMQATDNERLAILASQGMVRLGGKRELPASGRINCYREALKSAKRPDEKRQAIAGLGDIVNAGSIDLLVTLADDAALAPNAAQSLLRMAGQRNAPRSQLLPVLEKFRSAAISDDLKKKIDAAIAGKQ